MAEGLPDYGIKLRLVVDPTGSMGSLQKMQAQMQALSGRSGRSIGETMGKGISTGVAAGAAKATAEMGKASAAQERAAARAAAAQEKSAARAAAASERAAAKTAAAAERAASKQAAAAARAADKQIAEAKRAEAAAAKALEKRALGVNQGFGGAFGRAAMLAGGAAGVGMLGSGIFGVNSDAQTSRMGVAALFSAVGGMDKASAVASGADIARKLSMDAAVGVGGEQDYMSGFARIFQPALQAGGNAETVRELTRLSLGAGFALQGQEGLAYAPMDIRQAMTSGHVSIQTPFAQAALDAAGISSEAFNKMPKPQQLEALLAGFRKFGPAVEMMGTTASARLATMQDHLKRITRMATEPLFDRWSGYIEQANRQLEQMSTGPGAAQVGQRLGRAWDQGAYAAPAALGLAVAAKGGLAASGAAAEAGGFGAMISGWLEPIGVALSRMLPWTVILTAVIGAVTGALAEFQPLMPWLMESFAGLGEALWTSMAVFGSMFGEGSPLNLIGGALVVVLVGLVQAFAFVINVLNAFVAVFVMGARMIGAAFQHLVNWVSGIIGYGPVFDAPSYESIRLDTMRVLGTPAPGTEAHPGAPDEFGQYPQSPNPSLKRPVTNNITNIGRVVVHVERDVNADPTRVAASFEQVLNRIRKAGRQPRGGLPQPI